MYHTFIKRLIWFGLLMLRCFIVPINKIRYFRRSKRLPALRNNLLLESATSLSAKIRLKKVTSVEVVNAYISRLRDVNPLINAIVEERFKEALLEAMSADMLIQSGSKTLHELEEKLPFLGVPISVKESVAVRGMSHAAGMCRIRGRKAGEDAEVVRLMRQAGAIPLVVTNTPELCCGYETYNYVTGRTNNPYDLNRTVGGSSGGEAAVLSSAGSVIGLCSDVAGSVRLPAFFTGVFGHKSTPGVVSHSGHFPTSTDKDWGRYLTMCPMTRYAEDLIPLLRVLSDKNAIKLKLDQKIDVKDLKVYYMEDDAGSECSNRVHPEITAAMRAAVAHLEDKYGIKAQKVKIDNLKHGLEYASSILGKLHGLNSVFQKTEEDPDEWNSVFLEFVKYHLGKSDHTYQALMQGVLKIIGDNISESQYQEIKTEVHNLRTEIKTLLGDNGVLLYPTFTEFAHHHYEIYFRWPNTFYMSVWSVLELPVTQCPLGLGNSGLPMGIQLVAAPYNDRLTITLAAEFESAFGGWIPPPHSSMSDQQKVRRDDADQIKLNR